MRVTRRLILQKARHQATGKPATPFDCLWARGFRYYFTPLIGVLFTFPSRYSFTIGRQEYLALDGGPPSFPHERPSTWYSGGRSRRPVAFVYGAVTLYGLPFLTGSTSEWLCDSAETRQGSCGVRNSIASRGCLERHAREGDSPVGESDRSP